MKKRWILFNKEDGVTMFTEPIDEKMLKYYISALHGKWDCKEVKTFNFGKNAKLIVLLTCFAFTLWLSWKNKVTIRDFYFPTKTSLKKTITKKFAICSKIGSIEKDGIFEIKLPESLKKLELSKSNIELKINGQKLKELRTGVDILWDYCFGKVMIYNCKKGDRYEISIYGFVKVDNEKGR